MTEKIAMCPNCGNNHKGDTAKKCAKCKKVTCQKCSFTGCSCGSTSYEKRLIIGILAILLYISVFAIGCGSNQHNSTKQATEDSLKTVIASLNNQQNQKEAEEREIEAQKKAEEKQEFKCNQNISKLDDFMRTAKSVAGISIGSANDRGISLNYDENQERHDVTIRYDDITELELFYPVAGDIGYCMIHAFGKRYQLDCASRSDRRLQTNLNLVRDIIKCKHNTDVPCFKLDKRTLKRTNL